VKAEITETVLSSSLQTRMSSLPGFPADARAGATDLRGLDHLVEARGTRIDVDERHRVGVLIRDRDEVEVRPHGEVGRVGAGRRSITVMRLELSTTTSRPRAVEEVHEGPNLLAVLVLEARTRRGLAAGCPGLRKQRFWNWARMPVGGPVNCRSGLPATSRFPRPRPPAMIGVTV
jgi:hypothetical protein